MRKILPFLAFFSRKSNFLDNRDTSKKQLRANWSMGGIKEILSRFGNNKWEWLLGGGPSARKHRIGDFGDLFSVADQHPWWIFVFFGFLTMGRPPSVPMSHISRRETQMVHIIDSWRNIPIPGWFTHSGSRNPKICFCCLICVTEWLLQQRIGFQTHLKRPSIEFLHHLDAFPIYYYGKYNPIILLDVSPMCPRLLSMWHLEGPDVPSRDQ